MSTANVRRVSGGRVTEINDVMREIPSFRGTRIIVNVDCKHGPMLLTENDSVQNCYILTLQTI